MLNLVEHAWGLDNDAARRVNEMIQEHYPRLSLRRVPESDPAFDPRKPWGVYEEGVRGGLPPWVFMVGEYSLDHRILARLFENDNSRATVRNRTMESLFAAEQASQQKARADEMEQRRDEALQLALALKGKNYVRMEVDGDKLMIGDDIRRTRTFIT